jgi:O-acetylhomoserine (thiol)-lyase
MSGFITKSVHGPASSAEAQGALRVPVYDSVAFECDTAAHLEQVFAGRRPAHSYTRVSNPTVQDFEARMTLLSGARGAIAVSSGMAAISNVVLTLAAAGTNIVTTRSLFGNTLSLLEQTLGPWGLEVRFADFHHPEQLREVIDEGTRALFFETITNPQLEVADAAAISRIAHEYGVPVIADGTATTPYLFPSREFGIDVEVISSTKYISGGATTIGGVILDNGLFDWKAAPRLREAARQYGPNAFLATLRREVYRNLGACLAPHNAFLQTLGLETLSLRIDRSCANTLALAKWLNGHTRVQAVNYPGLEQSPDHAIARNQFRRGSGGILTFSLAGKEECFAFMDALSLVRRATNLHDNKTLILHPASTIFCEYSAAELAAMGVGESLLRLAVGIEDVEDIMADLDQGFSALANAATALQAERTH